MLIYSRRSGWWGAERGESETSSEGAAKNRWSPGALFSLRPSEGPFRGVLSLPQDTRPPHPCTRRPEKIGI